MLHNSRIFINDFYAICIFNSNSLLFYDHLIGPGGEPVMLYQRRALGNITGSVTNNLVRPPAQGAPVGVVGGHGYPRPAPPPHPAAATPPMAPTASHYPRPHLVGHDINIMCKLFNLFHYISYINVHTYIYIYILTL